MTPSERYAERTERHEPPTPIPWRLHDDYAQALADAGVDWDVARDLAIAACVVDLRHAREPA